MENTTAPDPLIPLRERTAADTAGDVSRVLGKLEQSGQSLRINRILANSSTVFRPFILMSDALMNRTPFPPLEREVVIMRLAARRGVAYEWAEHVPMSARAGMDDATRDNLARGDDADLSLLAPAHRLAVDIADQVVDEHALDLELWNRAVDEWGEEAALDLLFVIGWWGALVPLMIESLGLRQPRSAPDAGQD